MRRYPATLMLAACLVAGAAAAQPTVQARIVATDPSLASATLGRGETFNVRIEYTSDAPVKLWARPYFHGKKAPAMSNPSRDYVGTGYARGWFAFREPVEVDEIRITAGGGEPYREWLVESYPVQLRWADRPARAHTAAPWVAELKRADKAAEEADYQRRMSEPTSPAATALVSGFVLLVLIAMIAGFVAPVWAFRRWNGGWRVAAAVPLVLILFVVGRIVVGTAFDPTSHNLWPFEIGTFALVDLGIIGSLAIVRRITGAGRS